MQRCINLAALGAGHVAPNPMVGALLVHGSRIIGEGYHQKYGEAHAEVNCINSVAGADKPLISDSTMYVTLEPCAHFGKTPPCTDLLITHNIPRVVIGCRDSYEEVNGKGIARLEQAGVEVITGVLEHQCLQLNKRFFCFHQKRRPYVILKWAQSSDGKIGGSGGGRVLISNDVTNRMVHRWRSEEASILVGTNTALSDDPSLTTRLWAGANPVRLVIDMELKLPGNLKLFDGSNKTVVFNYHKNENFHNLLFHRVNRGEDLIPQVLLALHQLQIQSVLVEGGAVLLQSFIDSGIWDEARVIVNTALNIGVGTIAPQLKDHVLMEEQVLINDVVSFYRKTT